MTELETIIEQLKRLNDFKTANLAQQQDPLIISERPNAINAISQQIQALLLEGKIHQNSDWAAHMTGVISSNSLIGQLLSSLHNGNLLSSELYPILKSIKQQTLDWLFKLFGLPHGHFTSGASYGNLEALWQARRQQPNRNLVYASQTAHYSIEKACQILGLKLQRIATDQDDKIVLTSLRAACERSTPLAIVVTAGMSLSGNFDPIDGCIKIANDFNTWCHIDAAWGGYLKLLPEYSSLFGPLLAQANSLCFDPHKAWAQPKPASVLLYKKAASPMIAIEVDYLQKQPDNTLHGSQGGESFLPLWFTLISSGIDKLRQDSRQALEQAQIFSMRLKQQTNWSVFTSPSGIVCFKTDKNLTKLINQGIISTAKRDNKLIYRTVFVGTNTQAEAIIEKLLPYF